MRRALRVAAGLLAVLLLLTLGGVLGLLLLRNAQWVVVRVPTVELNLSDPLDMVEYETPLAVALLLSAAVGAVLALIALMPALLRRGVEHRRDRRYIGDLQDELSDLRNLPLLGPAPLEDLDPTAGDESGDAPTGRARPRLLGAAVRRGIEKGDAEDDDALLAALLREGSGGRGRGG